MSSEQPTWQTASRASRSKSGDGVTKTSSACATCRRKKVKCSGTVPCSYCSKRGIECTALGKARRSYSVTRIEELERRLAGYEGNSAKSPRPGWGVDGNPLAGAAVAPPTPSLTVPHGDSRNLSGDTPNASPGSTIPADSSLSSSHAFGSRIQALLSHSRHRPRRNVVESMQVSQPPPRSTIETVPELPNQGQALRLLEAVVFCIGQTQSHFDARAISDQILGWVEESHNLQTLQKPLSLQILVILAIGQLFVGEFSNNETVPGQDLFEFVLRHVPTLGNLYALGRLGIELPALIAVYLQNSNRKEEAYLYISTALRLAVLHGLHRKADTIDLKQSERVQLNRLWWTVYMQERRVAAATGNPSSVNDDVIEIDPPSDSPGFEPAAPMHTNIKVGKVTGRILSVLYGKELQTEQVLVPHVQSIVKTLYDISKEIPSELDTNLQFSGAKLTLRTVASLHLMLYQAIVLTIRPIMLHVAQLILGGDAPSGPDLDASSLGKLSRTCTEAARRTLKAIIALREKDLLVVFGFFDFEATFSAAFIMILAAIFDSVCPDAEAIRPSPGVDEALEVLQYLGDKGNHFALQRLQDIRHLLSLMQERLQVVGRSTRATSENGMQGTTATVPANFEQPSYAVPGGQVSGDNVENARALGGMEGLGAFENNLWDNITTMWLGPPYDTNVDTDTGEMVAGASAEDFYKHYYSAYNSGSWAMSGEDLDDLAALGRQIVNFGDG